MKMGVDHMKGVNIEDALFGIERDTDKGACNEWAALWWTLIKAMPPC